MTPWLITIANNTYLALYRKNSCFKLVRSHYHKLTSDLPAGSCFGFSSIAHCSKNNHSVLNQCEKSKTSGLYSRDMKEMGSSLHWTGRIYDWNYVDLERMLIIYPIPLKIGSYRVVNAPVPDSE